MTSQQRSPLVSFTLSGPVPAFDAGIAGVALGAAPPLAAPAEALAPSVNAATAAGSVTGSGVALAPGSGPPSAGGVSSGSGDANAATGTSGVLNVAPAQPLYARGVSGMSQASSGAGLHGGGAAANGHTSTSGSLWVSPSVLHLIGVPLLVLATVAVGFVLVFLQEILVPFVVSIFFVYLLRPLVNWLTKPCSRCLLCRVVGCGSPGRGYAPPGVDGRARARHRAARAVVAGADAGRSSSSASKTAKAGASLSDDPEAEGSDTAGASDAYYDENEGHDYFGVFEDGEGGGEGEGDALFGYSSDGDAGDDEEFGISSGGLSGAAAAASVAAVSGTVVASAKRSLFGRDRKGSRGTYVELSTERTGGASDAAAARAPSAGAAATIAGVATAPTASDATGSRTTSGVPGDESAGARRRGTGANSAGNPSTQHKHRFPRRRVRRRPSVADDVDAAPICTCWGYRLTRMPRWMAVLIALCVAFGVLSGLVLLVADAVQTFERDSLPLYRANAVRVTDRTLAWLNIMFHVDGSVLLKSIEDHVPVADIVQSVLVTLINAAGNAFLILLLVLYLLFEQATHSPDSMRGKVDDSIQRYIGIKTLISAFVGLIVYIILGPILHVRMAHLFGVLTFFLNYIPNVGPVIATAVPFPVVVLDPDLATTQMLLAFILPTLCHALIGNFLEPKVFGRSLELHPVVVIISLGFWYAIWGVPGAILSIPMVAAIRIVLSHVHHPYARFVIRLLEGNLNGSPMAGAGLGAGARAARARRQPRSRAR